MIVTALVRARPALLILTVMTAVAAPASSAPATAANAESLLVVDCLLPGQIRRLGRQQVYSSARRPIRTTAADCGIRGGEYVSYDRADYRTALNVWLASAQDGDPEAQTYVGEIFEKGLGVTPDYDAARQWYQRAAEKGFQRAQINLGHMYEKGLGGPPDPQAALSWYRRAAGMQGEVTLDSASGQPAPDVAAMQAEIRKLEDEASELRKALAVAGQQLAGPTGDAAARSKAALEEAQRLDAELARKRREMSEAQATLASVTQAINEREQAASELATQLRTLQGEVAGAEAGLARRRQEMLELEQALQRARDLGTSATAESREKERQHAELEAAVAERQRAIETQQARIAEFQRELDALTATTTERRNQLAELEGRQKAVTDGLMAGPEIVLIEPQLANTRSIAVVSTAVTVAPTRQVVGRVAAPAGLLSLTVNGTPIQANQSGVFTADVADHTDALTMRVVAVDQQGKRASLEFIIPPATTVASETGAGGKQDPIPNIAFGRYFALVIGNNNYRSLPRLSTAIADAEAVGVLLRQRYAFEVTKLVDADRYAILSALNTLRETLSKDDNLLVYYAGHGELDRVNERGYWLPVDAERESNANWISNTSITDILNVLAAKHVLVISDSCYAGSLTRSAMSQLRAGMTPEERRNWLETMTSKRARVVLSSGGVEPVLDAGGGDHSVFTAAVLGVLNGNDTVLDGTELYQEVAARVALAASRLQFNQVPEYAPIQYAGHEGGDFLLVPARL